MFGPEKDAITKSEVQKLLEVGHVRRIQFPLLLSNAVLVAKPEGKGQMCVDFRDLNKACPKDHYPLPQINQLVDSTSGFELLSMINAYQGYHQIQLFPDDVSKISFFISCGTFCYIRMPFELKKCRSHLSTDG